MKLDTEIKLRAEPALKRKLVALAEKQHRKPSDLVREHLWRLVDEAERDGRLPIGEQLDLLPHGAHR